MEVLCAQQLHSNLLHPLMSAPIDGTVLIQGKGPVPHPMVARINTASVQLVYTSQESHALLFTLLHTFQHCGQV